MLSRKWLEGIKTGNRLQLRILTNHELVTLCTITPEVRIGGVRVRVNFNVGRQMVLSVLLVTFILDEFIREILPKQRKVAHKNLDLLYVFGENVI